VPARRSSRPDWVLTRRREVGRRIYQLRMAGNLTQEELGNAVGIDRRSIQRFEAGTTDPQLSDLLLIAHALRCHITDLLN
jgi:transcriptional regulator with XRE-family HTH domain